MDRIESLLQEEYDRKVQALMFLEKAVNLHDTLQPVKLKLASDGSTVAIIDVKSGERIFCNVEGDNVPAMIRDVMNQGRKWLC